MRGALGQLLAAATRTGPGRRLLGAAVVKNPEQALAALGWTLGSRSGFEQVPAWPARADRFEDVAPVVLSSNAANRGVASMRLDEAAHLWLLARSAGPGTLVEIGRERGGSTFVLACAMVPDAELHSYDPHTKLGDPGPDAALAAALARYGLEGRAHLHVEDSHSAEPPAHELALVLVDGDPSYEGTRLDFERFCRLLRPAGHALFHDATGGGPRQPQLAPLLAEIEREPGFERLPDVGTFADFVRVAS